MIIRKAKLEDLDDCTKMSNIEEFRFPDGSVPDFGSSKDRLKGIFFVAEEKGEVVGFVLGQKLAEDFAYLSLLTVREDFRGKGMGKKLLSRFREELKKQGVEQYFLITRSSNKRTVNFYEKNGLIKGKQYTLFCENLSP